MQDATPAKTSAFLRGFKSASSSVFLAYLALFIIFSVFAPYFFTVRNLMNIGSYASIMGVLATGLTIAMITGGLDVSISSVAALSSIAALAAVNNFGLPVYVGVALGILTGILCGVVNAIMITNFKINPIITTLATASIFRGLCFIFTDGRTIMVKIPFFIMIGRGFFLGIPITVIIMVVIYIIFAYMLRFTAFGRRIYAIGGNPDASYLSGINVNQIRFAIYMVSGATSAIAGMMLMSQTGAGLPAAGQGMEMDVIAGVIIGGVSLSGGKGNIVGTFIGIILLATILNGMILLNVQSYYQMIVKGGVLAAAVLVDVFRGGGYK